MSRFRYWLSGPQGAMVYFGVCYSLVIVGALLLTGCITTEDAVVLDRYPTRSEIAARDAEMACKALARNLVQIARCDVRR